jgi:hypothetical protein
MYRRPKRMEIMPHHRDDAVISRHGEIMLAKNSRARIVFRDSPG